MFDEKGQLNIQQMMKFFSLEILKHCIATYDAWSMKVQRCVEPLKCNFRVRFWKLIKEEAIHWLKSDFIGKKVDYLRLRIKVNQAKIMAVTTAAATLLLHNSPIWPKNEIDQFPPKKVCSKLKLKKVELQFSGTLFIPL